MLDKLLGGCTRLAQYVVWAGGAMLLFSAVMTTADVLLRKLANWSFGGADEIAGYMFAISTAFAFTFAMLNRAHVRIDALYLTLPRALRTLLDIVGFVALGSFTGLIAYRAYHVWWGSVENSSVSITPMVTPLAVPQGFWLAGLLFFMVVFIVMLLRVFQAVFQRDWNKIQEMIGARSLDEEIAEETAHAAAEIAREHSITARRGQHT